MCAFLQPAARRALCASLLMVCNVLCAQELPIVQWQGGGGLDADIDYLWRYNLYEHSRWGLGISGWWPVAGDQFPDTTMDSVQLATNHRPPTIVSLVANAGYGMRDHQLKWGVGLSVQNEECGIRNEELADAPNNSSFLIPHSSFLFSISREYAAAGSRHMKWGNITDFGGLSSFMSLRMSDQLSAICGYRRVMDYSSIVIDVRAFRGGRLFDNDGLLYRIDGDTIVPENGLELRIAYRWGCLAAEALLGRTWPAHKPIAQLLAEYDITLHNSLFETRCYLQAGITPPNTPYIYMFDFGGTYGSFLYFRNSLLTVSPCEYTANAFVLASLRLRTDRPLYSVWNGTFAVGSNPRPFVGFSAAWGHIWGQDADGYVKYEGLDLRSPNRGVCEAVVGVDGLLRWGVVDNGVAFALRLHPWELQPVFSILLTAEIWNL